MPYLIRWNSLNRSRYYQLFSKLAKCGHKIYILQPPTMDSADTGFVQLEENAQKNVFICDVKVNKLFWNIPLPFNKVVKKIYYCWKINQDIKALVKNFSIDVILFYNLALYPLSKINSCIKIYDLGDDHIELLKHELGRFNNKLFIEIIRKFMNRTMNSCDVVTTVSQDLATKYPAKSYILPNGINLEDIKLGSGLEIRKKYGSPIVGFVGSLEYFINFDLIIETASKMKDVVFIIAGGGRQYDRLLKTKKIRKLTNLFLTGGLKHSEILSHIDAMDICLNTFLKTPLTDAATPIKLFEYLAYKKPIISTRINEVQNIDKNFIYYADSVEETILTIKHILSNPDEAKEKAEIGFRLLRENYTWEKISDDFLALVEQKKSKLNYIWKRERVMLKADLHCHTIYSYDCCMDVDQLIQRCQKTGINCLAVTDHNEIKGALKVQEQAPFKVIVGEEIFSEEGEVIGLLLKKRISPGLSFKETIHQIKAQGGVVYFPHPIPGLRKSKVSTKVILENAHLIEIVELFNSRTLFQDAKEYKWIMDLAEKNNWVVAAGSDAHTAWELGNVILEVEDFENSQQFLKNLASARFNLKKTPQWVRIVMNHRVRKYLRRLKSYEL